MTRLVVRAHWIAILVAVAGAAIFFYARSLHAADDKFPIYFEDSTLTVKADSINRTIYLPLIDLVDHLHLPYTNATVLETFAIGGPNTGIVLAKNSRIILVNGQQTLLGNPVLRENQQWKVPIDFLSQGLTRITGIEFRYKPGTLRIFAGKVNPNELLMNAQPLGSITRLTVGTTAPIKLELRRESAQHRAVFLMSPRMVDPLRERLEYRDRLVRSIAFEDSDGVPKIIVETSDSVGDIRLSSTDEGRVHFIDFLRPGVITEAEPAAAPATAPAAAAAAGTSAAPKLDPGSARGVRVVVIDPGHGGIDAGTADGGVVEKDLTLAISRSLRTALRNRLGVTVLLTRDSDDAKSNEARSAVANNNQANLFISLHIGYSANKLDSASSIYVIKEDFAAKLSPEAAAGRLFLPWFMGYHSSRQVSGEFAGILQEELSKALPEWKFPLRSGPIAVLASTTMPAVALEIGNLNDSKSEILDAEFQGRVVSTIAAAVERFAAARRGGV